MVLIFSLTRTHIHNRKPGFTGLFHVKKFSQRNRNNWYFNVDSRPVRIINGNIKIGKGEMLVQAQATVLQKRASKAIMNLFEQGETSVLVQAATGAGKTYIGFDFIWNYLMADVSNKVQIVVPTVALVEQFHETAQAFGLAVSVYHGELKYRIDSKGNKVPMVYNASARINITLPDTFATLLEGKNHYGFDTRWVPTLLLMDEAHKNTSASSQKFKEWAPEAWVLGMTATPRREQNESGEHLIEWYGDNLIIAASFDELVAAGRIVPPSIHEFNETDNELDKWTLLTEGHTNKSTMVVARDTKSAIAYVEAFRKRFPKLVVELITAVGNKDEGIAQQTPKYRQELQSKFKRGLIDVLVSVDTLCEGFDAPRAKFVMIMRSMTSEALYHQVVGRVLRMYTCMVSGEVKTHGYVMDFGGNHKKFGSIAERIWTPMDYAPAVSVVANDNQRVTVGQFVRSDKLMISCKCCQKVFDAKARKVCPSCKQEHETYVAVPVKDIFEKVYNMVDFNKMHLQALTKMFSFRHYGVGSEYAMMREIYNEAFGTEVFTATGVNPKHKLLEKLVTSKANLTSSAKIRLTNKFVLDALAA
jgi:superfamily II DNA or RNA helicase